MDIIGFVANLHNKYCTWKPILNVGLLHEM